MNINNRQKFDVVEKFRVFRSYFDKFFILSVGGLWVISTIWDICKLQRYWLDYTLEFYSCFFIIFMMIYSVKQELLPKKVYHSFRLITTMRGRGTLLIMISTIFLCDTHLFHKCCAILLFIGGIFYYICEILVPTTREEFQKIKDLFCLNRNTNNNKNNNTTTINNMNVDKTEINVGNINNINDLIESNIKRSIEEKKTENLISENIENKNDNNILENGEPKKDGDDSQKASICQLNNNNPPKISDNPYDVPEDF